MFTYVGGSSVSDEVKGPAFPEGRKPTRDETKEYKILQNKLRKYRTAIIKTLGLLLLCSGSLCVRACVRACARVCAHACMRGWVFETNLRVTSANIVKGKCQAIYNTMPDNIQHNQVSG